MPMTKAYAGRLFEQYAKKPVLAKEAFKLPYNA